MELTRRAWEYVGGLSVGAAVDPGWRVTVNFQSGVRVVEGLVLTPRVIGEAAGEYDVQDLKRVWHYLARFG